MLTNVQPQSSSTTLPEPIVSRKFLIAVLQRFRQEWVDAAGDQSLLDTFAPIGLVLVDLVVGLQLDRSETIVRSA